MIEYLSWDSNFFKKKIGKIEILSKKNNKHSFNFDDILKKVDYQLIYFFLDIGLNINDYIYSFKPYLVDTQMHLKIQVPEELEKINYSLLNINNFSNNKYLENIYKIAEEISEISRFSYDTNLKKVDIKKLYRKMIENSLNGTYGTGIILSSETFKDVRGFIALSLNKNTGKELLIGVEKEFKKHGIGKILIKKALNCCKDNKINELVTVVSAKNLDSVNFHLSQGYKIHKMINIYHLWLKA